MLRTDPDGRRDRLREQPFDFYGGGQEDLSEPDNFFCLFLEQENFFRRPFGPDYLGIEFYLFVSHEGMKRQRFHVLIS